MTSISEHKNFKDINLLNFLNGVRSTSYTIPEEMGFPTTGNIGSLLNSNPLKLKNIYDGIMFNPTNKTNSNETIVGRIHPLKKRCSKKSKNPKKIIRK